jgi:hypothetical protein
MPAALIKTRLVLERNKRQIKPQVRLMNKCDATDKNPGIVTRGCRFRVPAKAMCWESTPITALGPWTRGLLIRLLGVEGHRGAIEDSFETAKNELGSGHNETRSLDGWHRHVSLVMRRSP